jgi:hypothetical protein
MPAWWPDIGAIAGESTGGNDRVTGSLSVDDGLIRPSREGGGSAIEAVRSQLHRALTRSSAGRRFPRGGGGNGAE